MTSFGLFVTLQDFFVEGLVPMSSLGEDFYVYEEKQHRLRGRASGKIFRLGDQVSVELKAIDEVRRRLDFRIAGRERSRPEAVAAPERTRRAPKAAEPSRPRRRRAR